MSAVRVSELENGMIVLTESVPYVETASLGIWLKHGSRSESPEENGMFHFIEHALFKGTTSRSAREIAEAVDDVGGVLDAYTSKEETCYSIKVREKHFGMMLAILADMLKNPLFDPEEMDRERMVILEEIKMEEDNPEDQAYELGFQHFWKDHPLGRPILGTPDNIKGFTPESLTRFHRKFYVPDNMIVAAAGRIDHEAICADMLKLFPRETSNTAILDESQAPPKVQAYQIYKPSKHYEQVNFCLNFDGISLRDNRHDAFALLNTLLGGGMSSRLFQTIREERGLAYSVGSFTNNYSDCGSITIYGGCSPENFQQVMDLCLEELRKLHQQGANESELNRAKEQYVSSMVMSMESTQARGSALAKSKLYLDEIFDLKTAIRDLENVQLDEVNLLIRQLFCDETLGLYAVGPLNGTAPAKPFALGLKEMV